MAEQDTMFDEGPNEKKEAAPAAATPKQPKQKLQVQLPYLSTPGSIKTAFEKIRQASTPERVTNDFIQNGLGMKGGKWRCNHTVSEEDWTSW